jgi:hypothetical protein
MWYEPSRLGLLSFIHGCCSTGGPGQAGAEPHRWTRKCVEVKGLVDYSNRTEPTAQCMRKRKDHQTRLTDNDVGARHCIDPPLHFDPGHRQVLPPQDTKYWLAMPSRMYCVNCPSWTLDAPHGGQKFSAARISTLSQMGKQIAPACHPRSHLGRAAAYRKTIAFSMQHITVMCTAHA